MSFLKNILKPFVEFKPEDDNQDPSNESQLQQKDERKEKINSEDNTASAQTNIATDAPLPSNEPSQSAGAPASFGEYNKYFENLIEDANAKNPIFQGTDFKEFIDSKIDVEAIGDEETRYKTAFNVLKRTGLTKEKLVTTGQQYIKLIEQDLKGFENAYMQQYKTDVEQKEQLLQKKTEELQALNDKISALNQEMKQMSQQVVQNKEKLNTNKIAFISAGEEKRKRLKANCKR